MKFNADWTFMIGCLGSSMWYTFHEMHTVLYFAHLRLIGFLVEHGQCHTEIFVEEWYRSSYLQCFAHLWTEELVVWCLGASCSCISLRGPYLFMQAAKSHCCPSMEPEVSLLLLLLLTYLLTDWQTDWPTAIEFSLGGSSLYTLFTRAQFLDAIDWRVVLNWVVGKCVLFKLVVSVSSATSFISNDCDAGRFLGLRNVHCYSRHFLRGYEKVIEISNHLIN
jgi:hypothetical protein